MKSTKRYTIAQKANAVEMIMSGVALSKIRRMYGCHYKAMKYWLKQYYGVVEGELITLKSKV